MTMTRKLSIASLFAALLTFPLASADALPGTVSGTVEVTAPGCAQDAYKFPIAAESDGGPVWLVIRPAALGVFCPAIYYAGLETFAGKWSPETGGCIRGFNDPDKSLCIGAVPQKLVKTTTFAALCISPNLRVPCWSGTATIVRT